MSDIRELIDRLQNTNPSRRYHACEELRVSSSIPPEAIAALRLVSQDPDPEVAEAAIRALAVHGEAPSKAASERENPSTGDGDEPEPEGPDPEVQALAAMDDRQGLFLFMQDEAQFTPGLDAAEALARLGDPRGVEHLIRVLDGRSRYLSAYARESLKRLNHPRGSQASQGFESHLEPAPQQGSQSMTTFNGNAVQQRIFGELNLRETEDLLEIWQDHDTEQWTEDAFVVIGRILRERLGQLPTPDPQTRRSISPSAEPAPDDMDPAIKELWTSGDFERLSRVLEYEGDWMLRLDAAEALARSGRLDGLDYLIDALDSSNKDEQDVAAEILEGLNDPQGNDALRLHRGEIPPITNPPKPDDQVEAEDTPSQPLSPSDIWAAYRRKQQELEDEMRRKAPGAGDVPRS